MALEPQAPGTLRSEPTAVRSTPARDRLATLFPDPDAPAPRWWHRRRRALTVVIAVTLVASLVLAARAFGAGSVGYRTATVATRDVDAVLNGVATIEPVSQAAVAFPAEGTVATVNVAIGDAVAVGQPLASLDTQALTQDLHDKQAAHAQAELTLERALNGEQVSGSNPIALTAASPADATGAAIAAAQQEVLAGQQRVDAALNTATQALDAAATVCAAAGVGSTTPVTPTPADLAACQTATQAVLTAQLAVNDAQRQLARSASALDALRAEQAASSSTGAGSSPGGTDGMDGAGGGSPPGGATSSSPSSADLIAYQKSVDAAAAQVAVAEQAIAQATIVSPIAGTVESVDLAVGDEVEGASTTAKIVVVGPGGYEATTTVSVDQVSDVKVGQTATVVPDGAEEPLAGTVSSIGIAPDSTTTATSYRVVIGLSQQDTSLANGSTGSVAIVTESSRSALAVPTSAVTTAGDRHLVTVLDGSTTETVAVQVGVVGDTWTEITSGVDAGQLVVLADLAEPLPGSATDSSGAGANQPGGFPAGGPPAGMRPGSGLRFNGGR